MMIVTLMAAISGLGNLWGSETKSWPKSHKKGHYMLCGRKDSMSCVEGAPHYPISWFQLMPPIVKTGSLLKTGPLDGEKFLLLRLLKKSWSSRASIKSGLWGMLRVDAEHGRAHNRRWFIFMTSDRESLSWTLKRPLHSVCIFRRYVHIFTYPHNN